jgi:hypothetical protein
MTKEALKTIIEAARMMGRLGGKSKSRKKIRASQINGRKGGRPRKKKQ